MSRNVVLALAIFAVGAGSALLLRGRGDLVASRGLLLLLPVAFLAMGLYGIASGRVYGRSWEKYWGGWVYRTENPGYYWGYVAMYLLAGMMLLFGLAGGRLQ